MEQKKLYKDMTVEEQLRYVTDLSTFIDDKLPRLEHLGDAWERADRKDMETGLALLYAFQFARDFVDKALRYGDYAARSRRLRLYIDKVKQEVAKGLSLKGSDGHTYALVQATVPQRRRGRPTLQEKAAREQGIVTGPVMNADMERQVKIARLMGIEVIIDTSNAPRELNNNELAVLRQQKAAEKERLNPSLFGNPAAATVPASSPASPSAAATVPASSPASPSAAAPASPSSPASPSAAAPASPSAAPTAPATAPDGSPAGNTPDQVPSVAVSQQPTAPSGLPAGNTPFYRLHLDQISPFLSTKSLRDECALVHGLRTTAAAEAERAKALADVGADADTIAPHAQRAQETLEAYEAIYQKIDEDLATTFYRLQNDGDFREKWLQRFRFATIEDVSKDLMHDLRLHYKNVQTPEFDLRCKTIIEQESPEYAARMKAEAEKKREVHDLLRYIKRQDKPASPTRVAGMKERYKRLVELLGEEEAKPYYAFITKTEEDLAAKSEGA